jgi:hypothetical protein
MESDSDYRGVSFGLDASTADFKALPLGLEVDYLDTNFGLEISRIVNGTSAGSIWSVSSYNNAAIVYLGDRPTDWEANRYIDSNGNACFVIPADQFSVTQQHVDGSCTPLIWLYCSKTILLRFWYEYSNDNDVFAEGENVLQHAYNKGLIVWTKGCGDLVYFDEETVDGVSYYYGKFSGYTQDSSPLTLSWKIPMTFEV